jgi:hypothetical protein
LLAVLAVVMARKKRPGRSGVGGRTADFSRPNTIRLGEIVEEIVDQLYPWKPRMSHSSVSATVKRLEFPSPDMQRSYRKEYRTHAKRLASALTEVETLLASARGQLAWSLFYPLELWIGDGIGGYHPSLGDIERTREKRIDTFVAELRRFRGVCAQAIDPGFDHHPNYDFLKYDCAKSAHGLMLAMSNRKITSTKDGAFRAIASLLYEAVSGKKDAELKRACDSVLREIRRTPS